MENRLRIAIVLLMIYGSVLTTFGIFANMIFPIMGWAHDPGFGGAQASMVFTGIGTIVLSYLLTRDWF